MTEAIKKGSIIISAKPFAYTLSSKQRAKHCDNCLKSNKLFKCSGCQFVYYCGRDCQRESWSIHKSECANLKKISPKIIPDAARLLARIIIKLNKGEGDERGYFSERDYRKFKDLMSHYTDLKQDTKRMEHFVSLCGVLSEFFGETSLPNIAELMGIYGRMCINSFNILDPEMNSIGVGIYLAPSILDHSCAPNAVAVFEGTTIFIRALEDIPQLDWSQVKISYIDVANSTKDRRAELQSSYYFWCNCPKCMGPEPLIYAAVCPNPLCINPCSIDSSVCSKCGEQISDDFRTKFQEVTDFTAHHVLTLKTMAYLDISKLCLNKQEGIFHPTNIQYVRTMEAALEAAVTLNNWEIAEAYATKLIPGYLLYYREVDPLTGLLYLLLGKIQLHLEKPKKALISLRKAESILSITHGKRHMLMTEKFLPLFQQAVMESGRQDK
ncbi:histone-lysine N-methyltransferase SMYD3 isoform X2 [Orussus abietinus]|uniref:histone-lysine N-methyltransferase SMYD3 isoform X2 n=1 Tax=Orussus abietinus TaxID=222816 RepID=UPI000626711A|nr:histone-lysine N-methyltransferase SMYD3 isoform X2 [Orussus abietinus]